MADYHRIAGLISGGKERDLSIEKYNTSPNYCTNCKSIISLNGRKPSQRRLQKFCSRSCAAQFNNKEFRKRKLNRTCLLCPVKVHAKSKWCDSCRKVRHAMRHLVSSRTKSTTPRRYISAHALKVTSDRKQVCAICFYSTYVEVAHIKAISEFQPTSTLGETNAQSNLILLCPNHHKEYDRKLTDVHIRIARMGIEPMLA